MKLKPGTFCPLMQKQCIEMKCAWFTKLAGTNKNTGEMIDDWGCAVAWLPVLLVENSGETRQAAAAVESLRNENVRGQDATRAALLRMAVDLPPLIGGPDDGRDP